VQQGPRREGTEEVDLLAGESFREDEPELAEAPGPGTAEEFINGLDEDIDSRYEERQPLTDSHDASLPEEEPSVHAGEAGPLPGRDETETAELSRGTGTEPSAEGENDIPEETEYIAAQEEPADEPGTDRHENVTDLHRDEYEKMGIDMEPDQEESREKSIKPTPDAISRAFHRLEDEADEGTAESGQDSGETPSEEKEDPEGDGSLFS
jgi:hypothetical protein